MKSALLQTGKKTVFLELFQDLLYDFYVLLVEVLCIDQNIIQVYNHENIKLFNQDLIYISLEAGWSVRLTKKYYLVLKVAVSGEKVRFLFITFLDCHLMINTC